MFDFLNKNTRARCLLQNQEPDFEICDIEFINDTSRYGSEMIKPILVDEMIIPTLVL